ncbi:MAG: hypothetical protein K0Q52_1135 [Microbacterium sp.]|jgi:hypothetical protein|nr:hypothetical protein [Microbacterium sp.]
MSDRIDHAAEARRNIEGLHDYQSEAGMTEASMLTVAIEAQAHATLALVEQQRIANLIALDMTLEQYTVPADDEVGEEAYVSTRLRSDIRGGLGL